MSYGISRSISRSNFEPKVYEVIDEADQRLGRQVGDVGEVREWYEKTTADRIAAFVAHRDEPHPIGDEILKIGEWYDVTVKKQTYFGRRRDPEATLTWRICRYLGRHGHDDRMQFSFERWGAKAGSDPYAKPQNDTIGVLALVAVTPISPPANVAEKAKPLDGMPA